MVPDELQRLAERPAAIVTEGRQPVAIVRVETLITEHGPRRRIDEAEPIRTATLRARVVIAVQTVDGHAGRVGLESPATSRPAACLIAATS